MLILSDKSAFLNFLVSNPIDRKDIPLFLQMILYAISSKFTFVVIVGFCLLAWQKASVVALTANSYALASLAPSDLATDKQALIA